MIERRTRSSVAPGDHFLDPGLIENVHQSMESYKHPGSPKMIHNARQQTVMGTATGDLQLQVTNSKGKNHPVTLEATLVPGLGRHLFSSDRARQTGVMTVIDHQPQLTIRWREQATAAFRRNIILSGRYCGNTSAQKRRETRKQQRDGIICADKAS